jgi:iron(III) transport system ATP-binding protein
MAFLELQAISKSFGRFKALDAVDLTVQQGELLVLLGPSGCGKSTLLRIIAGLEHQDAGKVLRESVDISCANPARRDYGIVFQSYALFPNLDVAHNVAYGLRGSLRAGSPGAVRVTQMLELVGLPGIERKYPAQLSGGQQQRVALARALATAPSLLLLDEPLSALDATERARLRLEIRSLQQRLGITTIMVTHDQEEALAMADRIAVMRAGRIEQIGAPDTIYRQPDTPFVAEFIGRRNQIQGRAVEPHRLDIGGVCLHSHQPLTVGEPYRFAVRPEDIRLLEPNVGSGFAARVSKCEYLGSYSLVSLVPHANAELTLLAQFSNNYLDGRSVAVGSDLHIGIAPGDLITLAEI